MSQFLRVGSHRVDAGTTRFSAAFQNYVQKCRTDEAESECLRSQLRLNVAFHRQPSRFELSYPENFLFWI